jgi:hypothetical protein
MPANISFSQRNKNQIIEGFWKEGEVQNRVWARQIGIQGNKDYD